ncbi:hypothetical protein [Kribbella deserti]|uniref:Uncharacterized protein n=1 Tax=Kribbella deserti TaxID=1926257 RepID=A0ABV6QQX7_9ACTN
MTEKFQATESDCAAIEESPIGAITVGRTEARGRRARALAGFAAGTLAIGIAAGVLPGQAAPQTTCDPVASDRVDAAKACPAH